MRTVTFGSVEKILSNYCIGRFDSRFEGESLSDGFTKTLLRTGLGPEREYLMVNTSSTIASRYRKGKDPIKREIVSAFLEDTSRDRVILAITKDIIPLISESRIPNMIRDFCKIIETDTTIATSVKSVFYAEATRDSLEEFLADILIYAIEVDPRETENNNPVQIGNLPRRNESFSGREDIFRALQDAIIDGNDSLLLYGAGGIGKTQIALEYAYRNFQTYEVIWWIDCSRYNSLISSYRTFLRSRVCGSFEDDDENTIIQFRDYFNNHKNWLLIYDSCEGLEKEYQRQFKHFLPNITGMGKLIITTRGSHILSEARAFNIGPLKCDDAILFLTNRTGLNANNDAESVAKRLGYYPLALEYAGAYISATPGQDFRGYLDLLDEYGINILDHKMEEIDYENTISEMIRMTFERIRVDSNNSPLSNSIPIIMSFCAFLAPKKINLEILSWINYANDESIKDNVGKYSRSFDYIKTLCASRLDRDEIVRIAIRYALLTWENESSLSIHELLQEVLRNFMSPVTQRYLISLLQHSLAGNKTYKDASIHLAYLAEHDMTLQRKSGGDSILVVFQKMSKYGFLLLDNMEDIYEIPNYIDSIDNYCELQNRIIENTICLGDSISDLLEYISKNELNVFSEHFRGLWESIICNLDLYIEMMSFIINIEIAKDHFKRAHKYFFSFIATLSKIVIQFDLSSDAAETHRLWESVYASFSIVERITSLAIANNCSDVLYLPVSGFYSILCRFNNSIIDNYKKIDFDAFSNIVNALECGKHD